MILLDVPYPTWSQIVDGNSFAVYQDGATANAKGRSVWAGNRDFVYKCYVDGVHLADYVSKYQSAGTDVENNDDAVARIVGLTGILEQPRNAEGSPIYSPTFESSGMDMHFDGALYTATAGALSFFDKQITTEIKLRGGWYELMDANSVVGDYVEFSIIDKDNVLGYFGAYGLVVGTDVLELSKFVRTEYVSKLTSGRQEFLSEGASTVLAGLYFRIAYKSEGPLDVMVKMVFKTYE